MDITLQLVGFTT